MPKDNQGLQRKVCHIYTKGTFRSTDPLDHNAKFILAFKVQQSLTDDKKETIYNIGVTFFDVQTLVIYIG